MPEQNSLRDQLPSLWRPLFAALRDIERGIEQAYERIGVEGVRPRFSMALMFLDSAGPMTIRRLADECGVTHSAMSQSVREMRKAGLVESETGTDARSKLIRLTASGRRTVPVLRAEWEATEAALRELEAELPYPLSGLAGPLRDADERRPFADRVLDNLRTPA